MEFEFDPVKSETNSTKSTLSMPSSYGQINLQPSRMLGASRSRVSPLLPNGRGGYGRRFSHCETTKSA
jgi:hypothetical protein